MKHITMHLALAPFQAVESGSKKVEVRLNDAKRQAVEVGDIIIFVLYSDNTTKLERSVVAIEYFSTFTKAYKKYEAEEKFAAAQYYTEGEVRDLGVVVFSLK